MKTHRGITIVSQRSEDFLTEREILLYKSEQKRLVDWLLDTGKDPENDIGYSKSTVETAIYRIDSFYRYTWAHYTDGFTTIVEQDHAKRYLQHLATEDYESSYKKGIEKALKLLFRWRQHERGGDEWNLDWGFEVDRNNPREDNLTKSEMAALRGAALEYGDIPSYANVSPDERDRWKEHLSKRFDKPKGDVSKEDWKKANGWKVPSLVWTTLDGGLRPSEIEQATLSWVNLNDGVLEVSKEDGTDDNWIVGLRSQTVRGLKNWLTERKQYDVYTDSDRLWLTQQGSPYQTGSLNHLLKQLCEIANIETQDRSVTWLTLRETVAMHLVDQSDSALVRKQLRYKSNRSTNEYESSLEERQLILEQIY